jgi:arsenate reductase
MAISIQEKERMKLSGRSKAVLCAVLHRCAVALAAAVLAGSASHADPSSQQPAKVVFVCLHGSVKSVMAAAHFNRIAKERQLPFVAVARAVDPDREIPASIRQGLAQDGLTPADEVPHALTADEASAAATVFAFDEVPSDRKGNATVTYWRNMPPASKDYSAARDAIVRRVEEAAASLTSRR